MPGGGPDYDRGRAASQNFNLLVDHEGGDSENRVREGPVVNLLDQIDARLADPRFSLNRETFERASVSMLSEIHPNLVPITGGSDDGRDAEVDDPNGRIGVLVTSARDLAGVLANLRKGCRQMVKKSVPIRRVILINIAELNASKRSKIADAAAVEGFTVVQIYPRAWYAEALRRNPNWRLALLALAGGPYTLTRPPVDDLAVDVDATVGRVKELRAMSMAAGDVLVTGVPGVGKTHLVAQIDNVVFVEKTSQLDALTDHLLETDPVVVALDDAGARLDVLAELLVVRRAHGLRFRVVAVCWPHETEQVNDVLAGGEVVVVDRMTKPELGQILRALGITSDALLHRVLEQANGRPAWAVRLALLLKDGAAWGQVMRGESVRGEVSRYLRSARISNQAYGNQAYDILATLAVLGTVEDADFGQLADLLGTGRLELRTIVRNIAVSGLLDAQEVQSDQAGPAVSYSVQPELLASSIVADAFFSDDVPPVPLRDVEVAFPQHAFAIVSNRITAELVDAKRPHRPTFDDVARAAQGQPRQRSENLLRYFAMLGPDEATYVLGVATQWLDAASNARQQADPDDYNYVYDTTVERRGKFLAELAARTRNTIGLAAAVARLQVGGGLILDAGENLDSYLDQFFHTARTRDLGEPASVAALVDLAVAVSTMATTQPNERRVFAEAAARAIAPSWDANYPAPDQSRTFNLRAFLLPSASCAAITTPVVDRLEHEPIDASMFGPLIEALESWTHIACGYALPRGLVPSVEHVASADLVARRLADLLGRSDLTPGTRLRLNRAARPLELNWPEPDALFAALTASPALTEDDLAADLAADVVTEGAADPAADPAAALAVGAGADAGQGAAAETEPDGLGDGEPSPQTADEEAVASASSVVAASSVSLVNTARARRRMAVWEAKQQAVADGVAAAVDPYLSEPPALLCARLQKLQPFFRADTTEPVRMDLVFTHIATTEADLVTWLRAAFGHDVAHAAGSLIRKTVVADTMPADLLQDLLEDPRARRTVIDHALNGGTGRALTTIVDAIEVNDFGQRMPDSFIRITPQALSLLNNHANREVAALAVTSWAYWLDYIDRTDPDDRQRADAQLAAVPDWPSTMRHLVVPNDFDDHALERGLASLARHAPDVFVDLFTAHVAEERFIFDDFEQWAPGAQLLTNPDKITAWNRVRATPANAQAFWALAGTDTTWIAERLINWAADWAGMPDPPTISAILIPPTISRVERPADEQVAALFADHVSPDEILNALPDTYSGEDVERAEHRLKQATELAASSDPKVAAVGRHGITTYTEKLKSARLEARAREVRGESWF